MAREQLSLCGSAYIERELMNDEYIKNKRGEELKSINKNSSKLNLTIDKETGDTNYQKDSGYCEYDEDCINYRGCCACSARNKYFKPKSEVDCARVDCLDFSFQESCSREVVCLKGRCLML